MNGSAPAHGRARAQLREDLHIPCFAQQTASGLELAWDFGQHEIAATKDGVCLRGYSLPMETLGVAAQIAVMALALHVSSQLGGGATLATLQFPNDLPKPKERQ